MKIAIIIGLLIALCYSIFFLPRETGYLPRINPTIFPILYNGMVVIPISNNKALHVHHWIIYLSLLILLYCIKSFGILFGIVLGLFIQGLLYKDSFNIIEKNPYNKN